MTKQEKSKDKSSDLVKMTVYLSKVLKDEMDTYTKTKGFSNRSEMLRQAYRIQAKVFPIEAEDGETVSIEEHFRRIEQRLEQIALEQNIIKKEEDVLNSKESRIKLVEENLKIELEEILPEEIPDFHMISNRIVNFIKKFPDQSIQDHILMEELRKFYSESIIWAVLVKLKNKRIIKLERGAWKINDA